MSNPQDRPCGHANQDCGCGAIGQRLWSHFDNYRDGDGELRVWNSGVDAAIQIAKDYAYDLALQVIGEDELTPTDDRDNPAYGYRNYLRVEQRRRLDELRRNI